MSSSALWLPPPTKSVVSPSTRGSSTQSSRSLTLTKTNTEKTEKKGKKKNTAPTYEERCRAALEMSKLSPQERKQRKSSLFVPRSLKDFDDGGSFPEIHVAQYPRHMGNPHLAKNKKGGGSSSSSSVAGTMGTGSRSGQLLNVEIDAKGEVSYDAIVTGGTNSDKKVYTSLSDMKPSNDNDDDNTTSLALPTPEEEADTTSKTASALQSLITTQTNQDKPTNSAMVQAETSKDQQQKTQFIRYTPRTDAPGYNPSAKNRIIQMVPAQLDPMMPPKHQHRKEPRGPAEDMVPILHAPNEKLSVEERKKWDVPACISNWKNTRGYTIPLDKRLAADGRGLRDDKTINSNFATLSESLYVAERQAREEVKTRALVQKRIALNERERREEELRVLANQARMERANGGNVPTSKKVSSSSESVKSGRQNPVVDYSDDDDDDDDDESVSRRRSTSSQAVSPPNNSDDDDDQSKNKESSDKITIDQEKRERLRIERRKERERELRLEKLGRPRPHENDNNNDADLVKKRKLEDDRDVSEKIALGTHTGQGGGLGGAVDARLYNQSSGMDSGFGAEDDYNVYTKPMFNRDGVSASSIYRPSRGEDGGAVMDADEQYDSLKKGASSKFQHDSSRNAPVQFEKGG